MMLKRLLFGLVLALGCMAQSSNDNVNISVVPAITFNPLSLSFSSAVGVASATQTVTATNGGPVDVAIAVSLTGTAAGDFSQTNTCPGTLTIGASCTIGVTFTPVATGSRPADVQVRITSNNYAYAAAVSGTGSTPGVPVNTALPTVSGTALVGQAITATVGSWTNSPTSYSCQWRLHDTGGNVTGSGGTSCPSYTLASGDVGHTIDIAVTATNASGSSAPATSLCL